MRMIFDCKENALFFSGILPRNYKINAITSVSTFDDLIRFADS